MPLAFRVWLRVKRVDGGTTFLARFGFSTLCRFVLRVLIFSSVGAGRLRIPVTLASDPDGTRVDESRKDGEGAEGSDPTRSFSDQGALSTAHWKSLIMNA